MRYILLLIVSVYSIGCNHAILKGKFVYKSDSNYKNIYWYTFSSNGDYFYFRKLSKGVIYKSSGNFKPLNDSTFLLTHIGSRQINFNFTSEFDSTIPKDKINVELRGSESAIPKGYFNIDILLVDNNNNLIQSAQFPNDTKFILSKNNSNFKIIYSNLPSIHSQIFNIKTNNKITIILPEVKEPEMFTQQYVDQFDKGCFQYIDNVGFFKDSCMIVDTIVLSKKGFVFKTKRRKSVFKKSY